MTISILAAASGAPDASELGDPKRSRAWKAAQDFEAVTLGQLLAPMFSTVDPSAGPLGGGEAENTWRPMLTQEIAKAIAHHGGLGIAVPVYRQLLSSQEGS